MKREIQNISRRGFIKSIGLASGGLILACNVDTFANSSSSGEFNPNLFVQLQSDGTLILVASRSEMGNGVRTSITSIIADEMEADWDRVKIVQAVGDKKYGDQNTDGSRSVRYLYETMREMGAMARMMLIQSAANKWQVNIDQCYAENHQVRLKNSSKSIDFGDLVEDAAVLSKPKNLKFKDPKDFKYIGKKLRSVDVEDYATGAAVFGLDKRIPGMKFAAIARPPVTFGKVKSYDRDAALKINGVEEVLPIPRVEKPFGCLGGVAVIGSNTWAVFKGKSQLNPTWEPGQNGEYDTDVYLEEMMEELKSNPDFSDTKGDFEKAFSASSKTIEAEYRTPHLVHAPMEVPNAVAHVKRDSCEVWAPTQDPQTARREVADYLGIDESKVTMHVTFLGGGFGRKSKPDFIIEAVAVSRAIKGPVQVVWTREDDIQHSYYHTVAAQYMRGAIDDNGRVSAWDHRFAFPSIGSTFSSLVTSPMGWEASSATEVPYDIPNMQFATGKAPAHLRIGWLRSVINIPHGFSVNVFADELAATAGEDPLDFRLKLIGPDRVYEGCDTARLKNVLKKAAQNANWYSPLPKGHARGLAVQYSFLSYVASVVEVSVTNGKIKVENIHSVIDCGLAINKDTIESQIQGAAIFGLSLAFYGKITTKDGVVQEENFHNYPMLRMHEAPKVAVEIIDSDAKPTGVGEPGVPVIAPALVNAIYAATGERYRTLPLSQYGIL